MTATQVETMNTFFADIAKPMIARGVPMIPLRPKSKIAFLKNWTELASTDPAIINQWNQDYPGANGACVAFARPGGVWFLEIDQEGFAKQIEAQTGMKIPATFMVRSSPGRGHFYWKQSAASIAMGNRQGKTAEGKEAWSARVDSRYVVSSGSIHPTTLLQYQTLLNHEIVEAPDWLIEWCTANDLKQKHAVDSIPSGSRNSTITSVLGKARQQNGLEYEALLALAHQTNERCAPPLPNAELETIAGSIAKYPVTEAPKLMLGGKVVGEPAAPVEPATGPQIDDTAGCPRPVFPVHVMKGTSLYEQFAKPISDQNAKYAELLWMPAVQIMLNQMFDRVFVKDTPMHPNMYLGIISPPGKFFKSSSCRAAHDYCKMIGLSTDYNSNIKSEAVKTVITQAGSSEGVGISMSKINAKHAILWNSELSSLVAKVGIEHSSFGGHLLDWYEGDAFGNTITAERRNFNFAGGSYCFGWQWCTTSAGFKKQWPKIAGTVSGLQDRMFYLLTPEKPKPISTEVVVPTPGVVETQRLFNKAIDQRTYELDRFAADTYADQFADPRDTNYMIKLALYFAVDLAKTKIDSECLDRAHALVVYRQAAIQYLAPIEAENQQARIQQEILQTIRQNGGKMRYRQLCLDLSHSKIGTTLWSQCVNGLVADQQVIVFDEPGNRGQTRRMIGIRKHSEDD
jgi:hypothetical protein